MSGEIEQLKKEIKTIAKQLVSTGSFEASLVDDAVREIMKETNYPALCWTRENFIDIMFMMTTVPMKIALQNK